MINSKHAYGPLILDGWRGRNTPPQRSKCLPSAWLLLLRDGAGVLEHAGQQHALQGEAAWLLEPGASVSFDFTVESYVELLVFDVIHQHRKRSGDGQR